MYPKASQYNMKYLLLINPKEMNTGLYEIHSSSFSQLLDVSLADEAISKHNPQNETIRRRGLKDTLHELYIKKKIKTWRT
ncbi:hypothetical protein XELAEV_18037561mg [Xenopus laevis]|uniref:Uncharacterized protein n=1 Tax=Xenopus laevis TaxID=8355 RepID=A0A974HA99_XENLA|nr:hypothetical protein XELAEV_18037561mg [Xenopus laevis]